MKRGIDKNRSVEELLWALLEKIECRNIHAELRGIEMEWTSFSGKADISIRIYGQSKEISDTIDAMAKSQSIMRVRND